MAEVARQLAVSRRVVYRWLDGTRTPDRRTLLLAELLWSGSQAGEWPQDPNPGDPEDLSGKGW